jgi:hypothetical protein
VSPITALVSESDYPFSAAEDLWIEKSVTSAAADVVAMVGHLLRPELHHTFADALSSAIIAMPRADEFIAALLAEARCSGDLGKPVVSSTPVLQLCAHKMGVQGYPAEMRDARVFSAMMVMDVVDRYLAAQGAAFSPWEAVDGAGRALDRLLAHGMAACLLALARAIERINTKTGRAIARPILEAAGRLTPGERALLEQTLLLHQDEDDGPPVPVPATTLNAALDRLWSSLCAPVCLDKSAVH